MLHCRWKILGAAIFAAAIVAGRPAQAQVPAHDPSDRLREVLPLDVADRVLATIADARARQLPAAALEHRAVELAVKGVRPNEIESDVERQALWLDDAHAALMSGGRSRPTADETAAAASAISRGVDGRAVSAIAREAPSDRSLAVPFYVLSSLMDRGLPSDEAIARVRADLEDRFSDEQLQRRSRARPAGRGPGRPVGPPPSTGAGRIPIPPARGNEPPVLPGNRRP